LSNCKNFNNWLFLSYWYLKLKFNWGLKHKFCLVLRCQFHQLGPFLPIFFCQKIAKPKSCWQNVTREKLLEALAARSTFVWKIREFKTEDIEIWVSFDHFFYINITERFLKENSDNIIPYTWRPFGGGPRNCIGKRFAIVEMMIAMAKVLKRFRIEKTEETKLELKKGNLFFLGFDQVEFLKFFWTVFQKARSF